MGAGKRAIFLDRDGVINRNVFNPATGKDEAPLTVDQFALLPGVPNALRRLCDAGFLLFLVSNQPNYAKGKASLADIHAIDAALRRELSAIGVGLAATYYCLHHPDGRAPGYSGPCACRKPSPYFLLRARREFGLDFDRSWMLGDRTTDVLCGRAAGVRTVLIEASATGITSSPPDHRARDLVKAAQIICACS